MSERLLCTSTRSVCSWVGDTLQVRGFAGVGHRRCTLTAQPTDRHSGISRHLESLLGAGRPSPMPSPALGREEAVLCCPDDLGGQRVSGSCRSEVPPPVPALTPGHVRSLRPRLPGGRTVTGSAPVGGVSFQVAFPRTACPSCPRMWGTSALPSGALQHPDLASPVHSNPSFSCSRAFSLLS